MPTKSGREYQPLASRMAGPSQEKTSSNPTNATLDHLVKAVEDLTAQIGALQQGHEELKNHIGDVKRSIQGENRRRHRHKERQS